MFPQTRGADLMVTMRAWPLILWRKTVLLTYVEDSSDFFVEVENSFTSDICRLECEVNVDLTQGLIFYQFGANKLLKKLQCCPCPCTLIFWCTFLAFAQRFVHTRQKMQKRNVYFSFFICCSFKNKFWKFQFSLWNGHLDNFKISVWLCVGHRLPARGDRRWWWTSWGRS